MTLNTPLRLVEEMSAEDLAALELECCGPTCPTKEPGFITRLLDNEGIRQFKNEIARHQQVFTSTPKDSP